MLQLPWDFPQASARRYRFESLSFSLPVFAHLTEESPVDSASTKLKHAVIPVLALLQRYAQPERLAVDVQVKSLAGSSPSPSRWQSLLVTIADTTTQKQLLAQVGQSLEQHLEMTTRATPSSNVTVAWCADVSCWQAQSPVEPTSDLHWIFSPSTEIHEVKGILVYNAEVFRQSTAQRMVGHLGQLNQAMQESDRPLLSIPMLTPEETQQQQVEWQSTSKTYRQVPVFQLIETHAEQRPDAIALRFQDQTITYRELNQRANQLAYFLQSQGVISGSRVVTCFDPSPDVIVNLLAIFKTGATYVPIDPGYPKDRVAVILEDTQPQLLLTQIHLLDRFDQENCPILCPAQEHERLTQFPEHNPQQNVSLSQTAYIIYTSGTTGKPKGVMASHANLTQYIQSAQDMYGFSADDIMPAMARFTFSITFFELLSPLASGGQLYLLERDHILDYKRFIPVLREITVLHASPSLLRQLIAYFQTLDGPIVFENLRHVSSGGDSVPADLLAKLQETFVNADICVIYGCSEISCMGCTYFVPREAEQLVSRIGKPFPNVTVQLYDAQQNLVPVGLPGEIYVAGAGINQGYLNRSDLTAQKFIEVDGQRFYRTGDVGRWHEDGNLEILGRSDFQIKLRGIRMEPGEIEAALRKIEGIHNAVVAAKSLPGQTEKNLVAYVVFEEGQSVENQTIRQTLNQSLPDYMVPTLFVILPKLPLNPNGKVDRRALPELDDVWESKQTRTSPQTLLEKQLVEIWEQYLPVHPIGINQDFFELGGNSLISVQILMHIDKLLGIALPFSVFMQSCTVASMAALMSSGEEIEQDTGLVPLRATGSKPPLFCLYGALLYRDLADSLPDDQPVYGVYLNDEVDLLRFSDGGSDELATSGFASVPTSASYYIKTIQSLQPHGPYYLLGESFGGVVAYEIAQQLTAAGEEVAVVAMLDSTAPNTTRVRTAPVSDRLKKHIQFILQQGPSYVRQKIAKKIQPKLAKMKQAHENLSVDANYLDILRFRLRGNASRSYFVPPYDGTVVLFRAADRNPFEVDENQDLGWGEFASDLTVISAPGDHFTILQQPNVQYLADQLAPYLESARIVTHV